MALYSQEQMTTLHSASDVKKVASTALAEIEIMSIASAINGAANCGQTSVAWSSYLDANTINKLESQGYKVTKVCNKYVISWKE